MLDFVIGALRHNPEVAVFLSISLGCLVGRIRLGKFHLGPVAGSLLIGLLIGQIGLEVPHELKSVFFALFIYAVGFKSGPGFFGSLNRGTLKLVIFATVLCVTGLGVILLMNHVFGFDAGFAAGLGAGALTDTAMMGTASSALGQLDLDPQSIADLNSHMAIAYAISYLFGTVGLIIFVGNIAPRLLGVDLKASARELEAQLAGAQGEQRSSGEITPYTRIVVRAHRVELGKLACGLSIEALEARREALSIERVLRGERVLEREPGLVLAAGDVVGITASRDAVGSLAAWIGAEEDCPAALSYPHKQLEVVLTSAEFADKTLGEIKHLIGPVSRHGVFLNKVTRQGYDLPLLTNTVFRRGDVAQISGRSEAVDVLAARFGRVKTSNYKSDIALHTAGMVLGSLLGLLSAHVGVVPIELGVGGGVLLVALILGWLHSRYPAVGDLPPAAQWAFSELGLTAFAAVVGLLAGPKAVHAMQEHGLALVLAGVVITLVPPLVAFYVGRYLLKLHPMILLGALAGAQTEAASMNAIIEESQSQTPVIGFTVCYAVSNVLFAVWGPIIVALA
ncbi:aspartate-alanine antiporter [Uliginosibacterium aquaticum]|uniref:Aspartate-alanine antiporter n=1 Tax=Uliginosibacterium aquaticum TaxID=2731212 RepID=A0ABX2IFF6_9RHOO|nr:aspartate-alanine antiporter [Uliginosibacterium aquaticum]NSL54922.1 aspartate-alanine antiporter [Uliginosibacterium aquaticum]